MPTPVYPKRSTCARTCFGLAPTNAFIVEHAIIEDLMQRAARLLRLPVLLNRPSPMILLISHCEYIVCWKPTRVAANEISPSASPPLRTTSHVHVNRLKQSCCAVPQNAPRATMPAWKGAINVTIYGYLRLMIRCRMTVDCAHSDGYNRRVIRARGLSAGREQFRWHHTTLPNPNP